MTSVVKKLYELLRVYDLMKGTAQSNMLGRQFFTTTTPLMMMS